MQHRQTRASTPSRRRKRRGKNTHTTANIYYHTISVSYTHCMHSTHCTTSLLHRIHIATYSLSSLQPHTLALVSGSLSVWVQPHRFTPPAPLPFLLLYLYSYPQCPGYISVTTPPWLSDEKKKKQVSYLNHWLYASSKLPTDVSAPQPASNSRPCPALPITSNPCKCDSVSALGVFFS